VVSADHIGRTAKHQLSTLFRVHRWYLAQLVCLFFMLEEKTADVDFIQNMAVSRTDDCVVHLLTTSCRDWGLRNTRRTAFHAAVQHYCRELGITAYEAPMPITYANPHTQGYDPAQETVLPDTTSDIRSPISPRSPDAAPKSVLGFTPPQDPSQGSHLHRSHLTRARKNKSRKAAVRGLGADGGNG
jgi:hypothetical protein